MHKRAFELIYQVVPPCILRKETPPLNMRSIISKLHILIFIITFMVYNLTDKDNNKFTYNLMQLTRITLTLHFKFYYYYLNL